MRKAISTGLVCGLVFLTCSPLFAQRTKSRVPDSPRSKQLPAQVVTNPEVRTSFKSFEAYTAGRGVLLEWQMAAERGNIGFNIFRLEKGERVLVNDDVVYGSAARVGLHPLYGEKYRYFDQAGSLGSVYTIESLDLDGNTTESNAITPVFSNTFLEKSIRGGRDGSAKPDERTFRNAELNIPRELASEFDLKPATLDAATHQWVISRPGVRIGVKSEGIYRVTSAQLQAGGFDINSDSTKWQLYVNGNEQAIIVGPSAQYIDFYGNGVDTNESDTQGYFLIVGDTAGKRMRNRVARPSQGTVVQTNYNQSFLLKERFSYLKSILNGDADNFWGRAVNSTGTNISFNLSGIDFSSPTSTLDVAIQGFSNGGHTMRITLNGQLLNSINGVAQFPFSGSQPIPTSLLRDSSLGQGTNVLNLASIGPSGDFNLFDKFTITFNRKFEAMQNVVKAYSLNSKITKLRGFTSVNTRVFDISIDGAPELMTNLPFQSQGASFGADLPAARGKIFYAVEDTAVKAPASIVVNNPEMLGVPTHAADLIIIAYSSFMTEAEAWANYRRGQGFTVKVVNVDEVYNEFNYGVLSSLSIKSFLNYAYNSWAVQPRYVLLLGDASYDSRNYEGLVGGPFNLVPTRIVTTVFSETGSDEALSDFNNDGLAEMAIGRIPARVGSSITNARAKVVNWEANLNNPLNRGALFAYDLPIGYDFQAMSGRLRDELPVSTPSTMVNRVGGVPSNVPDPNQQALLAAMNNVVNGVSTGRYIVNYSGHGTTGAWAGTNFFWNGNVPSLTNSNNESLFTLLTCLNGYFLNNGNISLAETLVDATNGGAVAAWASTGLTTPDIQEIMAKRFYNQIGIGNITRMGDLIRDAKTTIGGGTDVRLSWALIGDPMLKVR